jgi:hypothetical protein
MSDPDLNPFAQYNGYRLLQWQTAGLRKPWRLLRTLFKETGDTDGADRPEFSTFHQPFGISKPHPLCLCLGTLFEFGLDFFDQGYCFWCTNFKGGVHVRALPKTAFQQPSPISEEGNLKSAPWSAQCFVRAPPVAPSRAQPSGWRGRDRSRPPRAPAPRSCNAAGNPWRRCRRRLISRPIVRRARHN